MKIIGLDVDGVLNSSTYIQGMIRGLKLAGKKEEDVHAFGVTYSNLGWDPRCIKMISQIMEQTDAHILFTSAWRRDDNWRSVLGEKFDPARIVDRTGEKMNSSREQEIIWWLQEHAEAKDITHITVIDDCPLVHRDEPGILDDALVLVEGGWYRCGLETDHANRMLDILEGPPNVAAALKAADARSEQWSRELKEYAERMAQRRRKMNGEE